ncbi:MAG TPA: glycosyltransferase family 39 protein [Chthonomonadales bacterium]|nr:glycosyltransferase family 39 protein [Chthonomonadales bacterium]
MSEPIEQTVQRYPCCCNVVLPACTLLAGGALGAWLGAPGGWPLGVLGAVAGGLVGLTAFVAVIVASGTAVGAIRRRRQRTHGQTERQGGARSGDDQGGVAPARAPAPRGAAGGHAAPKRSGAPQPCRGAVEVHHGCIPHDGSPNRRGSGSGIGVPGRGRAFDPVLGLILGLYAALCLLAAVRLPLAPDETYYWEWSRNLAWGYYDQGPLIAWWIRASCALLGETPLGVRAGIVVAGVLTLALVYAATARMHSVAAARAATAALAATPLAVAGGVIATYDSLLGLFWALALFATARIATGGGLGAWLLLGAACGFGILSKLNMALLPALLAGWLWCAPELRARIRRTHVVIAAALAVAIVAPNLWWQSQNDWMTLGHIFMLAGQGGGDHPLRSVGEFVGSQAALVGPVLFLVVPWLAWRARGAGGALWWSSAPALAAYTALALQTRVHPNWGATAWLGLFALAGVWAAGSPRARRALWVGGGVSAALTLLLAVPELRPLVGLRLPAHVDQMRKLYGGAELGAAAAREREAMERETGGFVAVGAATYDNASRLAFYMPGQPRTRCFFLGTRPNSYLLWNHRAGLRPGGNAIVADHRPPDDPLLPAYERIFERVVPVAQPVVVTRPRIYHGETVRYYLYRCYGYRPDPEAERPARR